MIVIGDVVQVNKDDAGMNFIMRAEVENVPHAEGDGWCFRDLDTGTEIWTNERVTVYKRSSQQPTKPEGE